MVKGDIMKRDESSLSNQGRIPLPILLNTGQRVITIDHQ